MDVIRSEEHFANSRQSLDVDRPNVTRRFRTTEIYYGKFFGNRINWYYGLHSGYNNDQIKYLLGSQEINKHTFIAGQLFGYQKMNLFKIKHL